MKANGGVGLWSLLNLMTFPLPAAVGVAMSATARHHDHLVLRLLVSLGVGVAVGVLGGWSQLQVAARWNRRVLPALYAVSVLILIAGVAVAHGVTFQLLRRAGLSL